MKKTRNTPRAAALEYGSLQAPRVIARAEGDLALLMAAAAHRLGTPVMSDEVLVDALARLELNEEIPEALYVAAAVVLSWAFRLTDRTPESVGSEPG